MRTFACLDQPVLSKRVALFAGDDDVIERGDIDQLQCASEVVGQHPVGVAWLRRPRGMVMRQDHGGGVARRPAAGGPKASAIEARRAETPAAAWFTRTRSGQRPETALKPMAPRNTQGHQGSVDEP